MKLTLLVFGLILIIIFFSGCTQPSSPDNTNQCKVNLDCDDSNPCTIDNCSGTPKQCQHSQNPDCSVVDQCQTNENCNDSNFLTTDICSGNPKKCTNTPKICTQIGGHVCSSDQVCPESIILAVDTANCCSAECKTPDSCEGMDCSENEKCVSGACITKTCSELSGNACSAMQSCSGNWLGASDTGTCCSTICSEPQKVLIIIPEQLYSQLKSEISIFSDDVARDEKVDTTIIQISQNASASDVKSKVLENKKDLKGMLLIGDIPYVKFANSVNPGIKFISDFYYADIDNQCQYNSGGAYYDSDTCLYAGWTYGPWFGRIAPKGTDQVLALKNYFKKNHDYRTGNISYDPKILYYNTILLGDPQYSNGYVEKYINDEITAIETASLYKSSDFTKIIAKKEDDQSQLDSQYLNEIKKQYEWVILNNHGWYGGHEFNILGDTIEQTKPNALFYELKSCSLGNFEYQEYAAGKYVFSEGKALLALADTIDSFSFNYDSYDARKMFLLAQGNTFADSFSTGFFSRYYTWIGDPTIKLRYNIQKTKAQIYVSKTKFDLGKINKTGAPEIEFTVKNTGAKDLILIPILNVNARTKEEQLYLGENYFYGYITINSNQERKGKFTLKIQNMPIGKYTREMYYIASNSDEQKIIPITISFAIS